MANRSKSNGWEFFKQNSHSCQLRARGRKNVARARALADEHPAIRVLKDTDDEVILKIPFAERGLKQKVACARTAA